MQPDDKNKPRVRWLPLRDGHAVPLDGLTEEALKAAARNYQKGPGEDIKHTTVLNAIVKALGFKGGFPEYKQQGVRKLEAVFKEYGLREQRDLFAQEYVYQYTLSREKLAGRLFHSGRPMPRRVFLGGEGFDWEPIIPANHINSRGRLAVERGDNEDALALAARDPSYTPLVLGRVFALSPVGGNFLGDVLLEPRDGAGVVPKSYWSSDAREDARERARVARVDTQAAELFRKWVDTKEDGWVDVLPVTDRLVLLRGRQGRWDFVFADLRDTPPPGVFVTKLAPEDVPSRLWGSMAVNNRALYTRLGVWTELEEHRAEEFFYASGGTVREYPGLDEVLRRYLVSQGELTPSLAVTVSSCPEGWFPVTACGRRLFVSPLVTIAELESFLETSGYRERRRATAPLEAANGEDPKHLPAAVTWFDALAYAAHVERTRGLPVRMLEIDEYLALHPGAQKPEYQRRVEAGCVDFTWPDGQPLTHWHVGSDYGVVRLNARFRAPLPWRFGAGGLPFLCSDSFGEWLQGRLAGATSEAAAINTNDLEALVDRQVSPQRAFFPADDWGAYQASKIGFRLCVDAS